MSDYQNNAQPADTGLLLYGLDGTNPLGFLAAMGSLQVLTSIFCSQKVTLAWQRHDCSWVPVIRGISCHKRELAAKISQSLGCPFQPDRELDQRRATAEEAHETKKKELKQASE